MAALTLSGCIDPGSGFEVLDRDAEPQDSLPADLPEDAAERIVESSSRFIAEHQGNALYLARATENHGICLAILSASGEWSMGCGSFEQRFGLGIPTGNYIVQSSGSSAPDEAEQVSPNVFAIK